MKHMRSIVSLFTSLLLCESVHAVVLRSSQIVNFNTGNLGADITTGQLDQ